MHRESDPKTEKLLRLAEAIAEGTDVDWDTVSDDDAETQDTVSRLKTLETLIHAHRDLPDTAPVAQKTSPMSENLLQWGPLLIKKKIGQGLMGEVYEAQDAEAGKTVSLLLRRPDWPLGETESEWFLKEMKSLSLIDHPSLISIEGYGLHENRAGIWVNPITSPSVEEGLVVRGGFTVGDCIHFAECILGVLIEMHQVGLLHRDLSAPKIFWTDGMEPQFFDVGSVLDRPPASLTNPSHPSVSPTSDLEMLSHLLVHLRKSVRGRITELTPCLESRYQELQSGNSESTREAWVNRMAELL